MTFEEFLIKKKIDPAIFKSSQELLFSEFESHFNQMGEKSFDHSKKFWFNKLRRAHHLKEEPKPEKLVETATQKPEINKASDVIVSAQGTSSENSEGKTTYKPRFKAPIAATNDAPPAQSEESSPKPVFKPRFKAGITSVPKEAEKTVVVGEEKKETEITKPAAYKPRFKAAYKPLFKASIIKKNEE